MAESGAKHEAVDGLSLPGSSRIQALRARVEARVSRQGQPSKFSYLQIFQNRTVHVFIFLFFLTSVKLFISER